MEKIDIDLTTAKSILENAFDEKDQYDLTASEQSSIRKCLSINLTYSYIFITELLAKSTNTKANTICIQSGANLDGAFDARSLCHKVIVPDQRINPLLGNSNEPFLNKPARIPSIDKQVAFKGKRIKEDVQTMISFLLTIEDDVKAFEMLKYAIHYLYSKSLISSASSKELVNEINANFKTKNQRTTALDFYKKVLNVSCEGESLVLCIHTALKEYYSSSPNVRIVSHPSNESGASGREIEDIDLFNNDTVFCCVELKDKTFDIPDIRKAVSKAIAEKVSSLLFVEGPNGKYLGDKEKLDSFLAASQKVGVNVQVLPVDIFLSYLVSLAPELKVPDIIKSGIDLTADIRAKKKTVDNWSEIAKLVQKEEL